MSDAPPAQGTDRKLFFGLFIFPLLIAVGMAVLLCTVVLMTHEQDTPEGLIVSLKKSSPSKRWQKAFELSNELNQNPKAAESALVQKEIIGVFGDTGHFDAKTRSYMALALSHFDTLDASSALIGGLKSADEEVRVSCVWSLAKRGDKRVAPEIAVLLSDGSSEVRKTAVYALGALGDPYFVPQLKPMLRDDVSDVRWNAALALARLGDGAGWNILTEMLDRRKLSDQDALNEEQIERVMTNAIKGLALIRNPNSAKILKSISKSDKNLRIRQQAMNALEHLERI